LPKLVLAADNLYANLLRPVTEDWMSVEQINSTVCRLNLRYAAQAIQKGDVHNACIFMAAAFDHAFKVIRPAKIDIARLDDNLRSHLNELNDKITLVSYGINITDYDQFRRTVQKPFDESKTQQGHLQHAFLFVVSAIIAIETKFDLNT
jgi:hypothetical protein